MERDDRERSRRAGDPGAEPDRLGAELPDDTAGFLEAQYDAMRRSLERSLNQRLRDLGPGRSPTGGDGPGGRLGRLGQLLVRFRPEIYLLLTLGLVGLLWYAGGPRSRPAQPTPQASDLQSGDERDDAIAEAPAPATGGPPLLAAETLAAVREDPNAAWRRIVGANRELYAAWLQAVAEARGLEPARVSSMQQDRFADYAQTASGSGPIPAQVLRYTRIGLFEYVYGLFERTRRGTNSEGFRVTLAYEDYDPALLEALLEELGLTGHFPGSPNPQDPGLQVAVLGRRMAGELPGER